MTTTSEHTLTAQKVADIFMDCLFKEGEDSSRRIVAAGIVSRFGLHPERLASHADKIDELLAELPEQFHEATGGGWSFLNACMDKHDRQWGEHQSMEQLFALGEATGRVVRPMPAEFAAMLPGGMPYFVVLNERRGVETEVVNGP